MNVSRRQFLLGTSSAALVAGVSACSSSSPSATAGATKDSDPTTTTGPRALVDRAKIGCYVHQTGIQANPVPPATLSTFESTLGKRFDIIHYFFAWGAPFGAALNPNVPTRNLMISWNPSGADITQILKATYDGYVAEYARAAKSYGEVVYIRFAAEMNGNWNSYSAAAPGGPTAPEFVLAWHRIVGIFRAVHADNVKFVWCPTEVDSPNIAGNHLADYWPGVEVCRHPRVRLLQLVGRRCHRGSRWMADLRRDVRQRLCRCGRPRPEDANLAVRDGLHRVSGR